MSEQMKECYNCKRKLPKSLFHDDHLCPECESLGIDVPTIVHLYECAFCNCEFSHKKVTKSPKYCSKSCYSKMLRSGQMVRQKKVRLCAVCGQPISSTRSSNAITCSDKCAEVRRHRARTRTDKNVKAAETRAKETKALSMRDVIKQCSKLHISYGQYQALKSSGRLDEFLRQYSDQ